MTRHVLAGGIQCWLLGLAALAGEPAPATDGNPLGGLYTNRMVNEPVLFVRDEGKAVAAGKLLFVPGGKPTITDPELKIKYDDGKDYVWKPGSDVIELTADSRIPFKTAAQMVPPPGSPNTLNGVLFSEGRFFHDLQVQVTYEHATIWPVQDTPPAQQLTRSLAKLTAKQPFKIVALGDSITEGYNASGFKPTAAPPYQPSYPQLVATALQQRFGAAVDLTNLGRAGTGAGWGLEMVAKVQVEAPDLVILAFGMNHSEPAPAFEEVMHKLRDAVQTACPGADIVLVAPMTGNPRCFPADRFVGYCEALRNLTNQNVALADVTSPWLELLKRKPFADLSGNNINHPNDFGHRLYAQVICGLFPVAAGIGPAGVKALERIEVGVVPKVLYPMRQPAAPGRVVLTGFYTDGTQGPLNYRAAQFTAKTREASGNVQVVSLDGDRVVAKEGGTADIEAIVMVNGTTLKASTLVVVVPFFRDYHQSLVLKLFLGMEGVPVERLVKEPLFQKPHDVMCTFAEALDVIRRTDNLTRGIPKIIYLVGWQKGGHDHGYPSWDEVNPKLKREEDGTALDSLKWLIREARKFNTTVSLHINMVDAYKQSPLWDEYVAKDCFAKDESGELLVAGIQMKGEDMYHVVYPKEWAAGLAQRRIDGLIQLLPELKEGHTIHIDVFVAQGDGGKPISPWHAMPGNGGLSPDKYVDTQRAIFHYWRDRGFDVTGEGIFWAHPPGEGFTGLQAMSWWYPGDPAYQMRIPECLMARGRTDRGGDGDFRFGSSMHGEEIYQADKDQLPGFLGMFCRTTLPWYYLSRLERVKFENDTLFYSDGVVARTENGKRIIRKGGFILREDDDLFVPALWHQQEMIAYSRLGYANRTWQMPEGWSEVSNVDIYRITQQGCVILLEHVPLTDGKLVLSVAKDAALAIVPGGTVVR